MSFDSRVKSYRALAASFESASLWSRMRSTGCTGASHSSLPTADVLGHALWLAFLTTASPPRRSCHPLDERQNLTLSEGLNPDFLQMMPEHLSQQVGQRKLACVVDERCIPACRCRVNRNCLFAAKAGEIMRPPCLRSGA